MMVVPEMVKRPSCLRMQISLSSRRGPCIEKGRVTYLLSRLFRLDILFHLTRVPLALSYRPTFSL